MRIWEDKRMNFMVNSIGYGKYVAEVIASSYAASIIVLYTYLLR